MTTVSDDADEYVFQLWSPYFPDGMLTEGLDELSDEYHCKTSHEIDIFVNEAYTGRIEELRELAAEDKKSHGEPTFRFLQILEHMR